MENILERDDYDKFMLFSYMEGAANQTISISNIQDRFSLTYFKATKLIDELIGDFQELELEDFFYIEKNSKAYTYSKNGLDSINRLLWIYGRRSLKMSLIDYLLKFDDRSIEDFSFDYYISLSKAYRVRNETNEFLDSYGLNFLKSKDYSEKDLRFFLAELYFNIFKEYEEPFENELISKTESIITDLQESGILKQFHGLEYHKLKFYLYITFMRNQKHYTQFKSEEPINEIKTANFESTKRIMKDFLPDISNLEDEVRILIGYLQVSELYSENLVLPKIPLEMKTDLNKALSIFFTYGNLDGYRNELETSLTPFFVKSLYFDNKILDNQFHADLSVFQDNYSEIFQLCIDICEDKQFVKILGDQRNDNSFRMTMMLKIIHTIPIRLLLTPVHITIDFSVGKEYNTFIGSMVDNLPFANLVVDNNYSKETDIYLSDILTNKINSKYIIWNSPPTAKDWEIFGDLVTLIKENKRNKHN